MNTPMFVALPTREQLATELNEAAGADIGEAVQAILDTYPDAYALHEFSHHDIGKPPITTLATRDQVVRRLIRQITLPDAEFMRINDAQVEAIERVLLQYHHIWHESQWSVDQALQLHLTRAETIAIA